MFYLVDQIDPRLAPYSLHMPQSPKTSKAQRPKNHWHIIGKAVWLPEIPFGNPTCPLTVTMFDRYIITINGPFSKDKFLDVNLSELGMRTGWIQFKCLVICRAQATEPKPCKPSPALVLACGNLMQLRMRILSSSWLALAIEMSMSRPWRAFEGR